MGWFSSGKSDEERQADQDRESRRAISEQKAARLAHAEKEAAEEPDNRLAQAIAEAYRREL